MHTHLMKRAAASTLVTVLASISCLLADEQFPKAFDTQELTTRFLSPREALDAIRVPEGFNVTLFASEPDVLQPIAMATDERGRLWVVENNTYAERPTNFETKLRDRIVILDDEDGDGRFDKRTVFWDEGMKATSVEIGFGGVWVLAAPNLLFIPDRDHDDVPDGEPVVVLNGWNDDTIRHNIVNGLRWGPDGWLYGRHGIAGTSVVGTPETAVEHRTTVDCSIWRFHPARRTFEVVCRGTTNPWGMDWDDHGQMFFINTVIGHLWHVVPGAYYQRMYGEHFDPHLYELLPQTADHFHWDTQERWSDIRKLGVTKTTDAAGGGHAHTGMMIYLGDNWPQQYRGALMTCNFHGRRVNHDRLQRQGATFVGKHEPDFLHSDDPWFRGIEMVYGPGGEVYIADWSDIGECHENDGVHRSSGRIFRVTFGKKQAKRTDDLSKLASGELVELQLHRNDWYVRQARRLLQERALAGDDLSAAKQRLLTIYKENSDDTRQLRALWSLAAIGATSESWLVDQLSHESEHVRVWAIQLLVDEGTPSATVRQKFEEMAASDSSGLVLSFLASALRRFPHAERWALAEALARRAKFANDPFYPLFVWYGIESAVAEHPRQAISLVAASRLPLLRNHVARRLTEELERQPRAAADLVALLRKQSDAAFRRDVLSGMSAALEGWRKASAPAGWSPLAKEISATGDDALVGLTRELSLVFGEGRAVAELLKIAKSDGNSDTRRAALRSLVAARNAEVVPLLQTLLTHRDLSSDAIQGLAAFDHQQTPSLLIGKYNSFRPHAQLEAVSTLVSRANYARQLLTAVAGDKIGRDAVSPFQLRQMQSFGDSTIDASIDQLWPELKDLSAEKLDRIRDYRKTLSPSTLEAANLSSGRLLFKQQCANCHTLFGAGGKTGPDLTGAQRQNLNYLLENIVDPSATVSKNFHMSIALLDDGRVLNGIVVGETEKTIIMQTPKQRLVLSRDEIEELRPSQLSLMPERLLDVLKPEQVRDLIGYLMSPSQVPLPSESAGS